MNYNFKGLFFCGIFAIICGIFLFCYSIKSYTEIRYLNNNIIFDELDNNTRMSTNDKYYKYLSIGDFLNNKLDKNKKLPIKNTSCVYVDYAQHNILSLYRLIYKISNDDSSRKAVVEGNIRSFLIMLENYKNCRKYDLYKVELQSLIEEIQKTDKIMMENRIDAFLNGNKSDSFSVNQENEKDNALQDENYENNISPNNTNEESSGLNNFDDNLINPYLQ